MSEKTPILLAATALLSASGSALLARYGNSVGIFDVPNQRSSHAIPTPRTGGIGMFAALALAALAAWFWSGLRPPPRQEEWLCAVGAAFFLLGLCEDILQLSEKLRLIIQTLLALTAAFFGPRIASAALPGASIALAPPAAAALTAFWYVGFVNIFNFLDGLDGYAAGEALCAGVFIAALSGSARPLFISAAAAGFLIFNFKPARLFMGDGGSYFLGFLLAASCVAGSQESGVPFAAFLLVLGSFIVDSAVTLAKRIARGEPWMKAHRSHYYQRLTDLGFGHARIALMNMGLTALLGISALAYIRGGACFKWLVLIGWAAAFAGLVGLIERAFRIKAAKF
ncbi:MAG: hypothetical protein KGI84_05295 [Elusimicrobia bacterium]|nr:hypothetical protein [Elusimicrobiota bacterium]